MIPLTCTVVVKEMTVIKSCMQMMRKKEKINVHMQVNQTHKQKKKQSYVQCAQIEVLGSCLIQ